MIRAIIIIFIVGMCCNASAGEKRYAKPDEGAKLNQEFVVLKDGTLYATHDKKRVQASQIYMEDEVAKMRKATIDRLDRERYWNDGVPPEKDALERYLEREEKKKKQRAMQEVLANENWVKHVHSKPKKEGG